MSPRTTHPDPGALSGGGGEGPACLLSRRNGRAPPAPSVRGLIENPRDSFFACVRRGRRTGLAASQCLTCTGGILAGGLVCNRERGGSAPRFLLKSHHASKARVIISVCGQRGQRAQLAGQTGNVANFSGTLRGGSGVSAAHVGPMVLRHRTSGPGAAGQAAWAVAARLPSSYAPIACTRLAATPRARAWRAEKGLKTHPTNFFFIFSLAATHFLLGCIGCESGCEWCLSARSTHRVA